MQRRRPLDDTGSEHDLGAALHLQEVRRDEEDLVSSKAYVRRLLLADSFGGSLMWHPMDRSPRVVKVHLWELEGKRHHRCSVCWLVVPQDAIGQKSLPLCRPDGGNEHYCVGAPVYGPWPLRERNHSDGWYDHTGDCAWCGAPTELPRPGYTLPESNCRHTEISMSGDLAVCDWCGKTMVGW